MSRRFDEAVEASWTRFEHKLAKRIRKLHDGVIEVGPAEPDEGRLPVTIERDGELFVAELVALSADDGFEEAAALGWLPPQEPEESPCWGVTVPFDEVELLVGMVSGALRFVYGVADPAFLAREAPRARKPIPPKPPRDADGDADDDPPLVMGFPRNPEELVELVEQTLATTCGPDVVRDDDGDFPIMAGAVPLWVQVQADAPLLRLFSFVVRSVRDVRQARIEIGILNLRTPLLKFTFEHGTITATYDLPAAPFFGTQLTLAIDRMSELLNEIAEDCATRVGGKLWLDGVEDATPSQGREESA